MNQRRYFQVISGKDASLTASMMRGALAAAAVGYRAAVGCRNALFNANLRRAHHLGRPAISIGNLTVGGTGKTPMVIEIACKLLNMGKRPAVLLRGYHASDGLSDEASLLADALSPHVMVHAHPRRRIGAANAIQADAAIDCFILDDAFQHRQARRDLDLVLIDATNPFGYDRLLPRGLLREPAGNLSRAQAAIITRADLVSPEALESLQQHIKRLAPQAALAQAAFVWTAYRDADNRVVGLDELRGRGVRGVHGVCGVGNPEAFKKMLCSQFGPSPVEVMPDHHRYEEKELGLLFTALDFANAQAVITTEKDWVKWRPFMPEQGWPLPVYRPVLGVQWLAGQDAIDALLERFDSDMSLEG